MSSNEKFNQAKFVEWMNSYLWLDYTVDTQPSENGKGICGKINFKSSSDVNFKSELDAREVYEHHDQDSVMWYLETFFTLENIDICFS